MADRAVVASPAIRLWRSFRTAAWLGWQIEANWADPFVFGIYAIAKPLALCGIVVVMFATATHGDFRSPTFTCLYIGQAFYLYVGAVMTGMTYAVLDDRERYRMLKTMYVAPVDMRLYLIGRGAARFATGSISVLLILLLGVLLHVGIDVRTVNWLLFASALGIGIVVLAFMGLLMAGVVLLLGHLSWGLGEAVASSLFLFSGAIFPLEVLPRLLRPIGYALPLTYWLELVRRSLAPAAAPAFASLQGVATGHVVGRLLALTAALAAVALMVFAWCDHEARERGLIDRTTNF